MNTYIKGYMYKEAGWRMRDPEGPQEWDVDNSYEANPEDYPLYRSPQQQGEDILLEGERQRREGPKFTKPWTPRNPAPVFTPKTTTREVIEQMPGFTPHQEGPRAGTRRWGMGDEVGTYNPMRNAEAFYGEERAREFHDQSEAYRAANPHLFREYTDAQGNIIPSNYDREIPVRDASFGGYHPEGTIFVPYTDLPDFSGVSHRTPLSEEELRIHGMGPDHPIAKRSRGLPISEDEWRSHIEDLIRHEGIHGATVAGVPEHGSLQKHQDIRAGARDLYAQHDWRNEVKGHPTYMQYPAEPEPALAHLNRLAHDLGLPFPETREDAENLLEYIQNEENLRGINVSPETQRGLYYYRHGDEETRDIMRDRLPGSFGHRRSFDAGTYA